ncbi:unnamed protein product [Durusdinium trenchii]|uniref:Methyltransferase type 11 domain-containing protein n=1 Tax=Durusdinium trenchii TaxID=1381693 RepID=A0ABP0HET8_9DINO
MGSISSAWLAWMQTTQVIPGIWPGNLLATSTDGSVATRWSPGWRCSARTRSTRKESCERQSDGQTLQIPTNPLCTPEIFRNWMPKGYQSSLQLASIGLGPPLTSWARCCMNGSYSAALNFEDWTQHRRLWLVQRGRTPKLLVLDGSGRLAMHLQDSLKHVEVVAADVKRRLEPKPLRSLWDKRRLSVDDVILKTTPPELKLPANNFDIIILPFVLHRLFDGDTDSLLALLRDALRCCSCQVLVAEDLTGETLRKWRPIVQGDWSAKILLDGVLPHGEVRDHFLSPIMDSTDRRYLVIDASKFQDRRKARESLLPATKHVSKIPP